MCTSACVLMPACFLLCLLFDCDAHSSCDRFVVTKQHSTPLTVGSSSVFVDSSTLRRRLRACLRMPALFSTESGLEVSSFEWTCPSHLTLYDGRRHLSLSLTFSSSPALAREHQSSILESLRHELTKLRPPDETATRELATLVGRPPLTAAVCRRRDVLSSIDALEVS